MKTSLLQTLSWSTHHLHGIKIHYTERQSRCLFVRTLAAQPEPIGSSMIGSLTLSPMGQKGGGDRICPIISLILEQFAYSKQISWSLQCQETHSREKKTEYGILYV